MDDTIRRTDVIEAFNGAELGTYVDPDKAAQEIIGTVPSAEPKTVECTGCKFIGLYDTEFPCVNCVRKTKDYYCGADMRGGDSE